MRNFDFDLDIGVAKEHEPHEISWLLNLANTAVACQDYESALILLDRASSAKEGRLQLSALYLDQDADLKIPIEQRNRLAEIYLRSLVNEEDIYAAEACSLLASLYKSTHPLASIAYQLKADRLNNHADTPVVSQIVKQLQRLGIQVIEADPFGAYQVSIELENYGITNEIQQLKRYLYQVAAEENASFSGVALLRLAELYCGNPHIASQYKQLAHKNGYPEILTRR